MHQVPPDLFTVEMDNEERIDPDVRVTSSRRQAGTEMYDDDKDNGADNTG